MRKVSTSSDGVAPRFNPRPALRPGDAPRLGQSSGRSRRFNPRPALRPGDATLTTMTVPAPWSFQSAPGLEAGRCRGRGLHHHRLAGVSIRARP